VKSIDAILRKLTFDDLHDWAGAKILNRGKGYVKRVDHEQVKEGWRILQRKTDT
jgi:hypothetical protein